MGACASKPKVLKDADGDPKTPEPALHDPNKTLHHQISDANVDKSDKKVVHEPQAAEEADHKLLAHEIFDDDQANKRRSLSLLFKQNEDVKVSTENEETQVKETVRQGQSETVKQESAVEEKPSGENQNNEVLKQESLGSKEKCSEESESDRLAVTQESSEESEDEDIVKQELAEVKIPTQLSGSRDEPSKAGKSSKESETPVKEVATEKVVEVVLDEEAAAKSQTKLTEESTVGKQENNQYGVERAFKAQVSP